MQKKRGRLFGAIITTLALALVASWALAGEKQPSENRVAVVNGVVITQADFDREMSVVQHRLTSRGKPLSNPKLSEIRKEVLENLIDRELLYQESQKEKIQVDEAAVNKQLVTLKKRFPNEAEFKTALSKANLTEGTVKSQLKREMATQQLIEKEFGQKITVSDKETKAYYHNHLDSFKQPEQVHASHILIKVDPQADESQKAEARKKLEKVREELKKGEDFATLAKEFSQGPSSAKGGDLGYFSRGQMVKPFEDAAFALKPGEVSDIVETKFGYHLIKVTEKKPATTIAYADIKDRLQQYLKQEKVRKELSQYIEKLKEKAKVERFLTENKE